MIEDSVIADVRRARDEIAKKFNYRSPGDNRGCEETPSDQRTKGRIFSSSACRKAGVARADLADRHSAT